MSQKNIFFLALAGVVLATAVLTISVETNPEKAKLALFHEVGPAPSGGNGGMGDVPGYSIGSNKSEKTESSIEYVDCRFPKGPIDKESEPISSPPASKALFDAPPSPSCGSPTNTFTTVCGVSVTTGTSAQSCTTLVCGSETAQAVTNVTVETSKFDNKICQCKDQPEIEWCAYARTEFKKEEQIFAYARMGGTNINPRDKLRCRSGATFDPASLTEPNHCSGLLNLGSFSLFTLQSGTQSCSWIAVSGAKNSCVNTGSVSCTGGVNNASTSCSTGVQPPPVPSPLCLDQIVNTLINRGDCWITS